MKVERGQPIDDIKRLQRCINDLVGIVALPALWSGAEPSQIVRSLLDVLPGMLHLELLYVRVQGPSGGPPIEMVQVAHPQPAQGSRGEVGET
jgi:hypothetical protein